MFMKEIKYGLKTSETLHEVINPGKGGSRGPVTRYGIIE
jgi:hypothetical protein